MESGGGGTAVQGQAEGQAQAGAGGGRWQLLRSILFQIVIFYFITSFFRGRQQSPPATPQGRHPAAGGNLFPPGQEMELLVYLTEWEDFNVSRDHNSLVWNEDLQYGDWTGGPNRDGSRVSSMNVTVPESVQQNGTWYLHVLLVKVGFPLDPEDEDYSDQAIAHRSKLFNKYRKRHIHNTVNLITGEAEVAPGSLKVPQGTTDVQPEVTSYYHPNLTINLVDDHTRWVEGSIPQPMDKFIEFDFETGGYFPILYMNDYWNLAQEYMPLNDTTLSISITLSFLPITMFKFNMYAAMSKDNPWYGMMSGAEQTDEEQDSIKQTLLETNPYLLGLTIAVSILHSVFEFLAFKNDVQFWRSRKTLEGLSVRSVFFNVFQSFIVLLYILDNETNFVIIISVFVGLLIEMWKVTKVVEIKIDRQDMIAGVLPRISFIDRPSYQSSTKKYDMMAFKYLGIVLFPLFIGYGVYSLLYLEHKGWYSFVLSMCYGFLLTFGFITMTPQLFINYKLKSVAHLPWRMLTYKALNTFIDDMFAFVIKMPTMYRIGCFRDDIVFFIFLYQRWIYRVDPKRVNEFGTSGEDHNSPGTPDRGAITNGPIQPGSEGSKLETDKKND